MKDLAKGGAMMKTVIEPLEHRWLMSGGSLDSTFGAMGIASVSDLIGTMAVRGDGKVLYMVHVAETGSQPAFDGIRRLDVNGTIDRGYASNGLARLTFAANSIILQSDGRLLVSGVEEDPSTDPTSTNSDFHAVVERLTSSGKLDTTFGSGGKFSLPARSNSTDSKISLHNGKILVYGSTNAFQDGFIVRLNGDGHLDKTFNRRGQVTLPGSGAVHSLSVGANERITALAGSVVRLTSAGAFDSTFSHDGISAAQSVLAQNMFVNADGSVLLVGTALNGNSVGGVVIERYTRRGDIDRSYGNSGILVIAGQDKEPTKVIEAPGGQRYVIGTDTPGSPDTGHIFVARLGQDGGFDTGFGLNGVVTLANAYDDDPLDAELGPHNTLVIAAEASSQPHLAGNSGEFFRVLL